MACCARSTRWASSIPSLAVSVRRLHDTGRSGWWLLVVLVPLVGWLIVLYFMVQPGETAENRYGPDPKSDTRQRPDLPVIPA